MRGGETADGQGKRLPRYDRADGGRLGVSSDKGKDKCCKQIQTNDKRGRDTLLSRAIAERVWFLRSGFEFLANRSLTRRGSGNGRCAVVLKRISQAGQNGGESILFLEGFEVLRVSFVGSCALLLLLTADSTKA